MADRVGAELDRARTDLRAFAGVLGVELQAWQAASLERLLAAPIGCQLGGRQSGKSLSAAVVAAWVAVRDPDRVVLLAGASEEGSRRLLATVAGLLRGSPFAASIAEESGSGLRLSNGSVVRALSASEEARRGWSADFVVGDEMQLQSEAQAAALLPTVAARVGASALLVGTASISSGPFFELCMAGLRGGDEGHVAVERWVSTLVGGDCPMPWLSATFVAAMEASMSGLRFDAEFRCNFQSAADVLLPRAVIDRVTADFVAPGWEGLRGPARVLAGVDWGATVDRSALCAIGRLAVPGRRLFAVAAAHAWPSGHPLPAVWAEVAESRAHFDTLTSETNGLGAPCTQALFDAMGRRAGADGGARPESGAVLVDAMSGRQVWADGTPVGRRRRSTREAPAAWSTRKVGVNTTAEMKAQSFAALRLAFEREELLLPASAVELRRELLALRVELTEAGGERIGGASGQHDDLPMALVLALGPEKRRGGGWATRFARLSAPESRLPSRAEQAGEGDDVESGGGLRLPRRPEWQSVAGPQLSPAPADADWRRRARGAAADELSEVRRRVLARVNGDLKGATSE